MIDTTLPPCPTTLLVTHTDRDGILSGAALLRALHLQTPGSAPDVLLTQGCYLALELEDLAEAGRRYQSIFACDTYWHPAHAERIAAGFRSLLAPGGTLTWIDHHPSSVEGKAQMQELIPGFTSLIRGDHEGFHEAVSLVLQHFGLETDPVASALLCAAQLHWVRRGLPVPEAIQAWMDVIGGLGRTPDLPAEASAQIVRCLAIGFETPIPEVLLPQGALVASCRARTRELAQRDWPRLPSVDGGWGTLLDLRDEPMAIAYELQSALFWRADRCIDYFVVQESNSVLHYVSGPRARGERDRLERSGLPHLRVGTHHKGLKGRRTTRREIGIDLGFLTRRRPASGILGPWIDAHPYIVKAPWISDGLNEGRLRQAGESIGSAIVNVLERFGWRDNDRRWQRPRREATSGAAI